MYGPVADARPGLRAAARGEAPPSSRTGGEPARTGPTRASRSRPSRSRRRTPASRSPGTPARSSAGRPTRTRSIRHGTRSGGPPLAADGPGIPAGGGATSSRRRAPNRSCGSRITRTHGLSGTGRPRGRAGATDDPFGHPQTPQTSPNPAGQQPYQQQTSHQWDASAEATLRFRPECLPGGPARRARPRIQILGLPAHRPTAIYKPERSAQVTEQETPDREGWAPVRIRTRPGTVPTTDSAERPGDPRSHGAIPSGEHTTCTGASRSFPG